MCSVYYLAFDPGTSTGWCAFDEEGEITAKGIERSIDALIDYLIDLDNFEPANRPRVVIVEDYRIFSKRAKAHIGSQVPTVQAIGMIRNYAKRWSAEYVLQPSSILPIAEKWSGVPLPKDHSISHDIAAYNHGIYYLQRNGIIKSRLHKEAT